VPADTSDLVDAHGRDVRRFTIATPIASVGKESTRGPIGAWQRALSRAFVPAGTIDWTTIAARALLSVLAGAVVALAAWGTLRRLTWYVATIQFANLTFARDLAHGAVFHRSPALDALADLLPPRTDVMAQTYVWDGGHLYSRYEPGFALLLAGAMRLFGEDAAHYVNPALFVVLLVVLMAIGRRLLGSAWLGAAVPALVLLIPTRAPWWALTPTHDIAAHCAGLIALYLAIGDAERPSGRWAMATLGLALGYAISIRTDAVLYAIPVALAVAARRRTERGRTPRGPSPVAPAVAGLLLGMLPFLSYNWLVSGNPLRPAQAMELDAFWSPTVVTHVQGGGLRAENLGRVVPEHLLRFRSTYGQAMLGAVAWGALVSAIANPLLFAVTVSYVVAALLLFGCWGRADSRLLLGIDLLLPILALQGTLAMLEVVGRLRERGLVRRARVLASIVAFACGAALFVGGPASTVISNWGSASWVPEALTRGLTACTMLALLASLAWNPRIVQGFAAPVLLAGLVVLVAIQIRESRDAPFQRAQAYRARTTWATAAEPGSVVITSADIGRPAENIEYYAAIPALYLADLERWQLAPADVSRRLLERGMHPYLLIGSDAPGHDALLARLSPTFRVERVDLVLPVHALEYFVAPPIPRNAPTELYRITSR
jgi:hypothetical protein